MKTWIAHTEPPQAALNGSANLTEAGLYHNQEIVTRVSEVEVKRVIRQVDDLFEKAWDIKPNLQRYIYGDLDEPGKETLPQPPEPSKKPRYQPKSSSGSPKQPAAKRKSKKGCGCSTAVVGTIVVVVAVYILSQLIASGQPTGTQLLDSGSSPSTRQQASPEPPDDTPSQSENLSKQGEVPQRPSTSGLPDNPDSGEVNPKEEDDTVSNARVLEDAMPLIPLAESYVMAMVGTQATLEHLARQMNAINQEWDRRTDNGLSYSEAESTLTGTLEDVITFRDSVRYQRVPPVLRGIHGEPSGPIHHAGALIPLAEAVLAGLRIPAPNEGSERQEALSHFNATAQEYIQSVEHLLKHIARNAEALHLTTNNPVPTTTTYALVELSEEGTAYVEGLTEFKVSLESLVADINAVNEAWDNRTETAVSFSETEAELEQIAGLAQEFYEQVQNHPVPRPVRGLGESPPREAAPVAEKAAAVLAGLRIPAPNPGFERLAALDDFNAAAERFNSSVEHVIAEVHTHAPTSGLAR